MRFDHFLGHVVRFLEQQRRHGFEIAVTLTVNSNLFTAVNVMSVRADSEAAG